MPALVAGIHVLLLLCTKLLLLCIKDVDGRDEPGHDAEENRAHITTLRLNGAGGKKARRLLFAPLCYRNKLAYCGRYAACDRYAALGGTPSVSLKNASVRPQARSAACLL
jgi:hypothetical protein